MVWLIYPSPPGSPPFPLISPSLFIPPFLTAPICPHSVKVPGGDRRNRRVFCAQLTQSAQSIYNLPFKRWGFFDPTPWTRNQFTATLFVLIFFTMHQSCNCISHNIQDFNTLVYLWSWAIKVSHKKKLTWFKLTKSTRRLSKETSWRRPYYCLVHLGSICFRKQDFTLGNCQDRTGKEVEMGWKWDQ